MLTFCGTNHIGQPARQSASQVFWDAPECPRRCQNSKCSHMFLDFSSASKCSQRFPDVTRCSEMLSDTRRSLMLAIFESSHKEIMTHVKHYAQGTPVATLPSRKASHRTFTNHKILTSYYAAYSQGTQTDVNSPNTGKVQETKPSVQHLL